MAKIFRGASRVLAWLDGGAEEEQGVRILHRLSRSILSATDDRYDRDRENVLGSSIQRDRISAIHKYISLAWFTRALIIQEVNMNTDVSLICGASEITWARFTAAVEVLRNLHMGALGAISQPKFDALQIIVNLWKFHNMSRQPLRSKKVATVLFHHCSVPITMTTTRKILSVLFILYQAATVLTIAIASSPYTTWLRTYSPCLTQWRPQKDPPRNGTDTSAANHTIRCYQLLQG